jgi:hypothetical protein
MIPVGSTVADRSRPTGQFECRATIADGRRARIGAVRHGSVVEVVAHRRLGFPDRRARAIRKLWFLADDGGEALLDDPERDMLGDIFNNLG